MAAASHSGFPQTRQHGEKAKYAQELHKKYGLPNVATFMQHLNVARKAAAYGDIEAPELDAESLVADTEH